MRTHRNCRPNICTRNHASGEHRDPHTPVRALPPIQAHESRPRWNCAVARQRIHQAGARCERGDRRHELRERNHRQAHDGQALPHRVVEQLRNWERERGRLHRHNRLHGKEEREHVREPDEPGADDREDDTEGRE